MKTKTILVISTVIMLCPVARADDARLKETLRTLTLRLRSAETERNNLLSEKAEFDQERKTLTAKVDALTKQTASQKGQIDELTKKSDEQDKELTETKDSLGKWKAAYDQLSVEAKKIESERTKFASESVVLKRKLDDRERKNLELFKLGNEILARYERFGLGDALAAREPFTGITKVKLETLVQDYQDKIADNFVKPEKQSSGPSSNAQSQLTNKPTKPSSSDSAEQGKPTPR